MTWLDRLLVALARFALGLLQRRCSPAHRRVWWPNIVTFAARAELFPDGAPEAWPGDAQAGLVTLAFGSPGPHGLASPPPPLLEIGLTRDMLDMFIDGAVEVRNRQDIQLQALRPDPFGLK